MKPMSQSRRRRSHRLNLEILEDRTLLSTFTVDRLTDTGQGSDLSGDLRYCVSQAADGDNIQFSVQGAINLTGAASRPLTLAITTDSSPARSAQRDQAVRSLRPLPPGFITDDYNCHYVTQVYLDLLQRPADQSGLDTWTTFLDQGNSGAELVQTIQSSLEYRALVVQRLYGQIFGRPVDPSGFMTWVSFLGQGHTARELQSVFFGSEEYFLIAKGGKDTNDEFLKSLYRDLLQREIDPSGFLSWGQALSNGVSRTAVAAAILNSVESDRLQVTGLYAEFLHRQPDNGGLNAFTNALQQGVSSEQVLAAIVSSDEYRAQLPPFFSPLL